MRCLGFGCLGFNHPAASNDERVQVRSRPSTMGRAIVRHPKVFLFDEPLSNLDAKLRVQMRIETKKVHRRAGVRAATGACRPLQRRAA
jgi:ABC-type uncharacterized transport system YnjBCD ATPase subunit